MINQPTTKELRIYNGKTLYKDSLFSIGQTGQLHAKESNRTIFFHHVYKIKLKMV